MTGRSSKPLSATRRDVLAAGVGMVAVLTVRASAAPAQGDVAAAITAFTRNAAVEPRGVSLSLPTLVEDGDYALLSVGIETKAKRLGVFSSGNPLPLVAIYRFGPAASPRVSTNIRLWQTQTVTVVAELADGTFRSASVDVSVSQAACRSD